MSCVKCSEKNKEDIDFFDVKELITESLEKRWELLGINEEIAIIDGFFNPIYSETLTDAIILGGPTVPMIMLIGIKTGRVYFFSYNALVPEKALP